MATTPGEMYSLSFWSAVNGDQKPGISHTMDVSVDGTAVDTVQAVGVGRPLNWVYNTVTFTASPTSTTSQIEFDDATPGDKNQGPTLDNVSLTAVPDVITASPETIDPQTIGTTPPPYPVATFTDSNPAAPVTNFTATISWGDTSHQHGDHHPVGLDVHGERNPLLCHRRNLHRRGQHHLHRRRVGVHLGLGHRGRWRWHDHLHRSGCSGTVTTPSETVQLDSTSTSGTILTTVDPANTAPDCGPTTIPARAEVTTYDAVGVDANIVFTMTFANNSVAGNGGSPLRSATRHRRRSWTTTATDGDNRSVAAVHSSLPQENNPAVAPCVESITESPDPQGNPTVSAMSSRRSWYHRATPPKFH